MIINMKSMREIFDKVFSERSSDVLWEHYTDSSKIVYSYDEYYKHIMGIAKAIMEAFEGIEKNSWIGLKMPNNPLWSALFWACLYDGYNVFIMDSGCNEVYLDNVVRNSGVQAIIALDNPNIPGVRYKDGRELYNAPEIDYYDAKREFSNKIALGTSGTTGTPKIFVHTGRSICAQINNVMERYKELDELNFLLSDCEKNMFTMFPNHHIAALMSILIYEILHGKVVTVDKNTISSITQAIKGGRVQIAYSVPMVWDSIVNNTIKKNGAINAEIFHKIVGPDLKFVIMGAAKASPNTMELLNDAGVFSSQAYGMTEIGSLTSNVCKLINDRTDGCVGCIKSDVYETKLYSADGTIVDEGVGELMVSGDIVYEKILVDGREEEPKLFMDKYFLTGDRVEIKNNKLYILGRNKDVIINKSGENIYPDELEMHFSDAIAKLDSMVILGIDEKPVMVIKTEDDTPVESELIVNIANYNNKLPVFKRVREFYQISKEIPTTSNGKVKKLLISSEIQSGSTDYKKIEIRG